MRKTLFSLAAAILLGLASPVMAQAEQPTCQLITSQEQQLALDKQLFKYAEQDNPKQVFALIKCGANPLVTGDDGWSPATLLALYKKTNAVLKLAQINPDVLMQTNIFNMTPALLLAWGNKGDAVLKLARINPDILKQADQSGWTPTIYLAIHNNADAVLKLAKEHPFILTQTDTKKNRTPSIWLAIRENAGAVLKLAEEHPFILIQADNKGQTPITILAAQKSSAQMLGKVVKAMEDNAFLIPAKFWQTIDERDDITRKDVLAHAS